MGSELTRCSVFTILSFASDDLIKCFGTALNVLPYAPGIPPIVQSRINVANGKTRFTPGQPVSAGFDHVLDQHFNRPLANSRSIFSIEPDRLKNILQSQNSVSAPVTAIPGGQYVRVIDTGEVVGNTALKFGGNETTWIQVFTDQSGNLITTYPIPAPQSGENL